MYIEAIPNRGSPPPCCCAKAFASRAGSESAPWPISSTWPTALVEGFAPLKGGVAVTEEGVRIRRALPHGHAAAVLGTIRGIGLDRRLAGPPTSVWRRWRSR